MEPMSHPSEGLRPNWLPAIFALSETEVAIEFIMGNPGRPAKLRASLDSMLERMQARISRGEWARICRPLKVVKVGVVIESTKGIEPYPCITLVNISSEETGAPAAPKNHHG